MAAVGARARLDVAAALVAVGAGIAHGFPSCSRQGTIVAHIPAKEDKTERLNPNNARARPSKSPRRTPRKPVRTKESCTIRHARQNGLPVRLSSVRIVQRGENYSPEKPAAHYAYVLILPSCLIPEVPLLRLLARKRRLTSPSAPHAVPERDEAAFRSAQNARPGHTQSPPTPRIGPEQRRSPARFEPGFAIALWQAHRGGAQALPSCREPSGRRERQARKGHPGRREPSGRREHRERSGRQARQGRRAWPGRQEARLRIRGTPCQKTGLSPRISDTSCRSRLLLV